MTHFGNSTIDQQVYSDAHFYKHKFESDELGIKDCYTALEEKEATLPPPEDQTAANLSSTVMTITGINNDVQTIINKACTYSDYMGGGQGNDIVSNPNLGKYVTSINDYAFQYDYDFPRTSYLPKCIYIGNEAFTYTSMPGNIIHLESMDGTYIEDHIQNWMGYHYETRIVTVYGKDGYIHQFTFEGEY